MFQRLRGDIGVYVCGVYFVFRSIAVSYTHLDVYKRQILTCHHVHKETSFDVVNKLKA